MLPNPRRPFHSARRNGRWPIWAVVVLMVLVVLVTVGWVLIYQESRDCTRRGGVMVRGLLGYVCVPAR